jgi:hypothetical protein
MKPETWTAFESEIDRIVRECVEEPFDHDTIANVRALARLVRETSPIPHITKGYWSTMCFSWDTTPPIEIEVFGNRFEIYRFYDRRTDISELKHIPGHQLPAELAANLPRRDAN